MMSLLSKELFQLRPIFWLLVALTALSFTETVVTERIDEYRFSTWCEVFCQSGTAIDYGISLLIIVMIVAYSLFPTEHDEATIDFLHALPVSRTSVFIAKVSAGMLLLLLLILADYALSALLLAANPQSLDGKFYPGFFSRQIILESFFVFFILTHGILISWFRWTGLVIYAVYLVALLTLETQLGGVGAFSVFSVLEVDIVGQSLHLAWRNIAIHTGASVLILYISYRLWSKDHLVHDRGGSGKKGRWLVVVFTLLVFVLAASIMGYQSSRAIHDTPPPGLESVSTEHYRFVAREDTLERLSNIVEYADSDYQSLIAMLGIEQQPTIQADMTSGNQHALGVASWKKVRMNIAGFESDREYRRILSHETTHAFQSIESDRKLRPQFNATKFFIEGMAQYTSFKLVSNPPLRRSNWQLAAVAWKRQGIEFPDVIDFTGFKDRFDENLVYTLGDIWAQAMVDVCSERVLGDFLRAARDLDAPGGLSGREFWRRILAELDCRLETVIDQWLDLLESTHSAVPASRFPVYAEPVVELEQHTRRLRISVVLQAPAVESGAVSVPDSYYLKIRSDAQLGELPDALYHGHLTESGDTRRIVFVVPDSALKNGRIRYQLGYVPLSGKRAYFERWRRANARTEDAAGNG